MSQKKDISETKHWLRTTRTLTEALPYMRRYAGKTFVITGTLSDSDSNLILDDTVDIGSAATGINVTTTGVLSDIDGNLVLNDQTDIGSATTGLRIATTGQISDIDGNIAINDNVDLTGTLTVTDVISDSDSNLVLNDTVDIGSASTGINITTAGVITDIDGAIVDVDDTLNANALTSDAGVTIAAGNAYTGESEILIKLARASKGAISTDNDQPVNLVFFEIFISLLHP